jgi:hypothetical protein
MAKDQDDFMLSLAYLLGERTTPSTGVDNRKQFIQDTLNEVYRAYPWPFASVRTTLTLASGIATLPSTFDYSHKLEAYFQNGTDQVSFEEIIEDDQSGYVDGDYKYWITNQSDGTYLLHTKDTTPTTLNVSFQTVVPTINASISTPFNDSSAIAIGARRYVKLSQDPNADIGQDETLFQKRLNENISAVQVHRATRKTKIKAFLNNHRMGGGYE